MNHIGIKRADYKGATQKNIAKKRNNNMDPRQITRLAKLLRDNGDKVLSSEYKITLTGQLLRALNDSFTLITDPNETCTPNTFQVLKPNNAKSEVFRDLQIIYDFVQKAQILCLVAIPTEEPFDGDIDIKKFRNLKRLEIQKIPIEQIVGIQRLRAHLQELICSKSINSIQSIVSHCGGDNANGFLWNELKMADFSYNCLKTIDCSLEFVSNLQQLNLSHNQIHSVDAIKWLPNLKKLNLSFNNLSHIPQSIASRRLQSLILMNNFIENLSGLPKLEALNELNLADNCILDHAALEPLGQLIALQQLTLHGNPISHHPHYREETCKYLHKNVASVKFILDSQPLNKHEKSLVGYYQSFNNWSIKHRATKPKRSSGFSTPASRQNDMTPASSIGSFRSFQLENSMGSTVDLPNELSTSQISSSTQKKIKVRPALIADDDNDDGVEVIVKSKPPKQDKPIPTSANIDEMRCREHLKTKQQIEELRNEYGDEWLHSKGASKVQDVMGITPNQAPVKQSIQTTEERLENLFGFENTSPINRDRTSTPVQAQLNHADFAHSPIEQFQSPVTSTSDFKSVENSEQKTHKNADDTSSMEKTMFKSTISYDEDLRNLYPSSTTNEPESPSDSEENETIYLVINETNQIDLFLIVSEQSIREKNSLTSKTINKWKMTMLESCEHISTDVIRIRFDTIKRDKRERTYKMEKGEGKKLDDFLRNILSQRPLSDLMLIFRCANCALQFSQEKLQRKNGKDVKCPECGSTYVIEMKDTQSSPTSKRSEQVTLDKSNSHSSIEILDEPDPSVDSVDQVRITQANETHNANSDHEKIEVNETLLKPKKPMLTCMNLTESSSSGSVTDSVCTAYEHQAADSKATEETTISNIMTSTMTPVEQEQVHIPEIEKKETDTSKLEETSMISNMFGGLFNSTNILMARTTKGSKLEAPPCEKFKFSYKEFDQADHRLKLYLYQHIFEDDNEHLKWLVKGCLFNDTANNDPDAKLQPAIFLMSTTKWYVLNIIGKESDDVTKWVKRDAFGTINRVEQIRVLPWKVGITFTIKHFGHIHFFLQDIMRTDSLLLFFANNPLPVYCDLEYQISERVSQKLLQITNNVQLKMFTILNYCKIIDHNDVSTVYETAAFILTDSNLYVTTPKYGWLVEKMDHARIEVARVQLMTDLVDVENIDETTFAISFLDDVNDIKETWECKFETSSCLQNTFETMATSWEKIFKVPLAN
ncbi:serine/threonine-protein kinase 11-interacting protein isoform X4 [Contarinia nasturtii]|uniref:serine/threonine-protein kinase 11-interacting protein isoform X4 n=1 Tax=Contarinia nasturtii TaxID=265458 RepID=UPI0012D4A614|nr:serine/threonine-protein kinase 11-interacting protein isoform X4 [Contarinia nasturtii]